MRELYNYTVVGSQANRWHTRERGLLGVGSSLAGCGSLLLANCSHDAKRHRPTNSPPIGRQLHYQREGRKHSFLPVASIKDDRETNLAR